MDASSISIGLGNLLYRRMFFLYNLLYPAFKKKRDAREIAWMRREVRLGSCVLDIGANIGFYTCLFSDLVGAAGHVHSFEPDAMNFMHLSRNAALKENVTLLQKAVSDRTGKLLIYTSRKLNVDHRTYKVRDYAEAVEIEAVSIDDYVGSRFGVDLVKMDIQGFEPSAIRGMEKTIAANPSMVIFTEFWPHGLRQSGTSAAALYEYIRSLDLRIWLVEQDKLRPMDRESVDALGEAESLYFNAILSKQPVC